MRYRLILLFFCCATGLFAQTISNIRVTQDAEMGYYTIDFDLSGKADDLYNIGVVPNKPGKEIQKPIYAKGAGIDSSCFPGTNKSILWFPFLEGVEKEGWQFRVIPIVEPKKATNDEDEVPGNRDFFGWSLGTGISKSTLFASDHLGNVVKLGYIVHSPCKIQSPIILQLEAEIMADLYKGDEGTLFYELPLLVKYNINNGLDKFQPYLGASIGFIDGVTVTKNGQPDDITAQISTGNKLHMGLNFGIDAVLRDRYLLSLGYSRGVFNLFNDHQLGAQPIYTQVLMLSFAINSGGGK